MNNIDKSIANNNNDSNLTLRDYQKADVEVLSQKKSIAIFNEMRTGKTPTALAIFEKWPTKNLLIICPASLQTHWQESVEQWLGKPAHIISGLSKWERELAYKKFDFPDQKDWIVIISKDTFKGDNYSAQQFGVEVSSINSPLIKRISKDKKSFCVIVDEGHFLRNYGSDQSRSIYSLKGLDYKMVLTGTPMVNHASDIYGILRFLKPDEYNSYDTFINRYFNVAYFRRRVKGKKKDGEVYEFTLTIPKVLGYKSGRLREELQNRLNEFSVQRSQTETMPWLPKIDYQQIELTLTEEQKEVYDYYMSHWDRVNPLEILTKLKTLLLYPPALAKEIDGCRVYDDNKKEILTDEQWAIMKNNKGVKFNWLVFFCNKATEQSMIIFSTRSNTFLEPLFQELKRNNLKVGMIVGATSLKDRTELVKSFQSKEIDILLCNIISAGVGLNLSQADIIIFADRCWSPADNEQAEDRFLPVHAKDVKGKTIIDLVCEKTIDEKVIELLEKKQDITKLVLDNPEILF